MMTNGVSPQFRPRTGKLANSPVIPEIEVYLHLLVLIHLIDSKKYEKVKCLLFQNLQTHDVFMVRKLYSLKFYNNFARQ